MLKALNVGSHSSMKKIFVKDIKDSDSISDIFLVKRKGKGVSRSGNSYLTVILIDRSGEIEGRVWEKAEEFDKVFNSYDFVKVVGKASQYQGKPQLSITDISWVDEGKVSLEDFLKSSEKNLDNLIAELKDIYKEISNEYLKKLIFAFLNNNDFVSEFKRAPAATGVHHVYLGGLLEHVLSLSKLVLKVVSHYRELNVDLLLAGAFLHDIGKVRELSAKKVFDYTDEGKLLGHLVIGCEMVDERVAKIKDFPEDLKLLLKHMIVSHHGSLEFGSPKLPQTLEALVLHYLDDLDAKINTVQVMLSEARENNWTEYNKFLSRGFFKGDIKSLIEEKNETQDKPDEIDKTQKELDLFK